MSWGSTDPLLDFAAALEQMSAQGRRRQLRSARIEGPFIVHQNGERLLNFGSNDYLGVVAEGLVESSRSESDGILCGDNCECLGVWVDTAARAFGSCDCGSGSQ